MGGKNNKIKKKEINSKFIIYYNQLEVKKKGVDVK